MHKNKIVPPKSNALYSLQFASTLGAAVLVVFVLHAGRDVLIPFALSVLFAFLLAPAVNWLERKGLSNIAAVVTTAMGVLAITVGAILVLWASVSDFAAKLPEYQSEITQKVDVVSDYAHGLSGRMQDLISTMKSVSPEDKEPSENSSKEEEEKDSSKRSRRESSSPLALPHATEGPLGSSPERPVFVASREEPGISWQVWAGGAGAIFGPLGTAGLVAVFTLFLLINRDDLRDRFVAVISQGNYVITTEAISEASDRISRYLVAQLLLNVSYGMCFALGLLLIGWIFAPETGYPNVVALGFVAGIVRFVPYVGPFIGAGLPLAISATIFPGYSVFFAVLVLIVGMELLSNNIVEPLVYGSSTGVSAVAVIAAAVFWGWLWGAVGLLLATPLTVCLVVLGRYIPALRFFVTLLSDKKQIRPEVRIYQRLLSPELHKLEDAIEEEYKEREPVEFIDKVLIPTAKRILRDREDYESNDTALTEKLAVALQNAKILSSESDAKEKEKDDEPKQEEDLSEVCLCIAARHPAEKVVVDTLWNVSNGLKFRSVGDDDNRYPEVDGKTIADQNPGAILIFSLPRGGAIQTRSWCKSIREGGYQGPIIVVRPGRYRHFDRMYVSLRRSGATAVATSVAQVLRHLEMLKRQGTIRFANIKNEANLTSPQSV